jgi:dihydropteroate synthase type 2
VCEGIPVSVDSARPETQRLALAEGASYLNGIRGFPDPSLYTELASAESRLVVMHSIQRTALATRVETAAASIQRQIDAFFKQRLAALQAAGIKRERIILDPGLGYFLGSNPQPSLRVLAHLAQLKERFGAPVLVSPSRKSFLRTITGRDLARIGPASLAAELYASAEGVDYVRTDDVAAISEALLVLDLIRRHA